MKCAIHLQKMMIINNQGVPFDCHRLGQSRDSGKEDRPAGVSGEGMGDSIIKDGQWCEPHCLSPFK